MTILPGTKANAGDLKREPGSYILYAGKHLYYVIGPVGLKLLVENALTGDQVQLNASEVHDTELVRRPEPLDVPDCLPENY